MVTYGRILLVDRRKSDGAAHSLIDYESPRRYLLTSMTTPHHHHPRAERHPGFTFWIVGIGAFIWILMRSGLSPRRISYPCQRAALPLALNWLLSVLAIATGSVLLRRFTRAAAYVLLSAGVAWLIVTAPGSSTASGPVPSYLPVWQVPSPVSTVFVLDSIGLSGGSCAAANASVPDAALDDPPMDSLVSMMDARGLHLYRTAAHPDGVVGADNVVLLKGNYQWNGPNSTNTDRVKGLIRLILNHPDGFTGEIIVCDNTEDEGTGLGDSDNNSDDPNQSIADVINTFRAKGHPVWLINWNYIYSAVVGEYSAGDYTDGYLYDTATKINYPKFRSPTNRYLISTRYGVWDSLASVYDRSRMSIINLPVLKAHGMAGATAAIKNWIGLMTTAYANERYGSWSLMHSDYFFSPYALVARVMAVTMPELSILDATWTTTEGPNNPTAAVRTNVLFASTDPAAVSWYATKYLLTPVARWPDMTDPDKVGSKYHDVLNNWVRFLADSAHLPCTIDSSRITVIGRRAYVPPPPSPRLGPMSMRDNFDRADTDSLSSSGPPFPWLRLAGESAANADCAVRSGTVRGYNPNGTGHYGGVVWDSLFSTNDTLRFGFVIASVNSGEQYLSVPDVALYYHMDGSNRGTWSGWMLGLNRWNPGTPGDYYAFTRVISAGAGIQDRGIGYLQCRAGDTVSVQVVGNTMMFFLNSGLIGLRTDERFHPAQAYVALEMRVSSTPTTVDNFLLLHHAAVVPESPVPVQPVNGAMHQVLRPSYSWTSVAGADRYRFQLSVDSTFAAALVDDSTLGAPSLTGDSLRAGTTFFWRVAAGSSAGWSSFSPAWKFSTRSSEQTVAVQIQPGWNLLAVPVGVADGSVNVLFPGAASSAFSFDSGRYHQRTQLIPGRGYWLKFPGSVSSSLTGEPRSSDSIEVGQGWNMIGGLSDTFSIGRIQAVPADIIISRYFGYTGVYTSTTLLRPGSGYWVKTGSPGRLFLSADNPVIRAIPLSPSAELETPPFPPGEGERSADAVARMFGLEPNVPNPFNPSTVIRFSLPVDSRISVRVYDVLGRNVAALADGILTAGVHTVSWNASAAGCGIYFCRLDASGVEDPSRKFSATQKMLLIR